MSNAPGIKHRFDRLKYFWFLTLFSKLGVKMLNFNIFPNDHSPHLLGCIVIIFQLKIGFIENYFGVYLIFLFPRDVSQSNLFRSLSWILTSLSKENWGLSGLRNTFTRIWLIHLHEFDKYIYMNLINTFTGTRAIKLWNTSISNNNVTRISVWMML